MTPSDESPIRSEFLPLSILRALWKRKLAVVLSWLGVTAAGGAIIYSLPAVYQSRAVILIEEQRIPERYVASTVSEELDRRLNRISQQILSYDRLLQLINEFNLYADERKSKVTEEIVTQMRRDISVEPVRGWMQQSAPAFHVAYEGENPGVVREVTYRLATLFIDENLRARARQSEGTALFLESQLREARENLEEQEKRLGEFRLRHNGKLPQQEGVLLSDLKRLEMEIERSDAGVARIGQNKLMFANALASAEASLSLLRDMAEQEKRMLVEIGGDGETLVPAAVRRDLDQAERQLIELRARYSDNHPDIRRLRAHAEFLRESLDSARKRAASEELPEGTSAATAAPLTKTDQAVLREQDRIKTIELQIKLADDEIADLGRRRERAIADLFQVQSRLRSIPLTEQAMAQVNRDYEISQAGYKSLWNKRVEANLAAEMETRNQAEKFILLEAPRVPEKPVRPQRELLAAGVAGGALLMSCLIGFGIELRRNVLLGEWELPPGVVLLGQVPLIDVSHVETSPAGEATLQARGSWRRFPKRVLIGSSLLLSLAAVAAGAGFFFGWIPF